MRYIDWAEQMCTQDGDLSHIDQPDMKKFLQHQRDQYNRAVEADALDERWQSFSAYVNNAESALERGEPEQIAIRFCELGKAITSVSMPSLKERAEANEPFARATVADLGRDWPNRRKARFMEITRAQATRLWADDHGEEIRIGEMCERVYKLMLNAELYGIPGVDYLPGEPTGLK